ncbi:MAG TPA: hypothetical protein VF556_04905 [Pyrinomonadaceae bacterium]
MKNVKQIFKLKILMTIFFSLALNVLAAPVDVAKPKNNVALDYSLIANNLSEKLKADLAEQNLKIKFGNVEESVIANNLVEIKGQAFCILPSENTQLPINFEARVNPMRKVVADVQYKFVESDYAPSADEEILMRELMKQISRDYKTDQITIAIDGFETTETANSQKNLKGDGEIKIGEVEWSKIKFDVVLNTDKKATKIVYNIK